MNVEFPLQFWLTFYKGDQTEGANYTQNLKAVNAAWASAQPNPSYGSGQTIKPTMQLAGEAKHHQAHYRGICIPPTWPFGFEGWLLTSLAPPPSPPEEKAGPYFTLQEYLLCYSSLGKRAFLFSTFKVSFPGTCVTLALPLWHHLALQGGSPRLGGCVLQDSGPTSPPSSGLPPGLCPPHHMATHRHNWTKPRPPTLRPCLSPLPAFPPLEKRQLPLKQGQNAFEPWPAALWHIALSGRQPTNTFTLWAPAGPGMTLPAITDPARPCGEARSASATAASWALSQVGSCWGGGGIHLTPFLKLDYLHPESIQPAFPLLQC